MLHRAVPLVLGARSFRFNKHPPLGVNATGLFVGRRAVRSRLRMFQQAPTLGGECYSYRRRLGRRYV